MDTLHTCVLGFAIIIALTAGRGNSAYTTYVLEEKCSNGSVFIHLDETGEGSAVILQASDRISYSLILTCNVRIEAPEGYLALLSVRNINLRFNLEGTCKDYVKIYEHIICERIYRQDEIRHFDSSGHSPQNRMDILYYTSPDQLDNRTLSGYSGFSFTITAFKKDSQNRNDSVFSCANGNFIWSGLTCDSHNNCGDHSDEDSYGDANCGSGGGSTVLIILGLLIVFVLIVMCVATLLCSKNETVRRFSRSVRTRTISFMPSKLKRGSSGKDDKRILEDNKELAAPTDNI